MCVTRGAPRRTPSTLLTCTPSVLLLLFAHDAARCDLQPLFLSSDLIPVPNGVQHKVKG